VLAAANGLDLENAACFGGVRAATALDAPAAQAAPRSRIYAIRKRELLLMDVV